MKPPEAPKPTLEDKLRLYKPLIVIALVSALQAVALNTGAGIGLMSGWMGSFLVLLATLKLFDVKAFVGTFSSYDPLAARIKAYACAYPLIELALGVFILAGQFVFLTNLVLAVVFAINAIGVVGVLKSGRDVRCACAGTGFTLPVGRVTLFEDLVMVMMAGLNLLGFIF